ncbi:MAG: dephospho-CoA kinase [Eubacteriales bacterium]|nr:dephospho-CoA kinase [Eubacteriales bacterium]
MILGIIGGVGSGKSTVTDLLTEKYGFTVYHTDDLAKAIEEPGEAGYIALTAGDAFGTAILEGGPGSRIDKAKLAALIYSDETALKKVNSIIHPLVWSFLEEKAAEAKAEEGHHEEGQPGEGPRIAIETALPAERFVKMCDCIWFVYTDSEIRIERLMASRGYSREKCVSMIENQMTDEEFTLASDYIIDNSGSPVETAERIGELL